MNIEISEVNQVVVDANAQNMMRSDFDCGKVPAIVEVLAMTLHVKEDKVKQLLSRRIKELQAEQLKPVLEALKTTPPKKRKKKDEAEKKDNATSNEEEQHQYQDVAK